ncbi:MAG: hypothetical protein GF347_05280 [Candidatus Moranbacteria bacterium]|nr:hypothetical protein [Candidatus Moranbacteria bacterium]
MIYKFKIFDWEALKKIKTHQDIELGEYYILKNNFGQFLGKAQAKIKDSVKEKKELDITDQETDKDENYNEYYEIIKKATQKDMARYKELNKDNGEILKAVRSKIKELELPMKLAGADQSLDNSCIVIAFTAENRVDFRELVRSLSYTFQKAVRLEQIGSRDEAKICGGYGPCGKKLCCLLFNSCSKSINTDMARIQQITHRGNERISGCCGRLMCCLAYEVDIYEELSKGLPKVGEKIIYKGKKGKVVNVKILQKKFLVKFQSEEEKWFLEKDLKNFKKLKDED